MTAPRLSHEARLTTMRFALEGRESTLVLELRREDGLDLLEWLGLDRPEFGRIAVSTLAALCRRRLWPMARNLDPACGVRAEGALRELTQRLLVALDGAEGAAVFG